MTSTSALKDVRAVVRGPLRVLLLGRLLDSVGSGMTLSLLIVYLSQVRSLSILTASLVLTWMAVIGLITTPAVGSITDRVGPRKVMLVALLMESLGVGLMGVVDTTAKAFAVATLMALGASGLWGPLSTFIAQVVPDHQRSTAFAVSFMMLNLGLGLGGLIGASIVDVSKPETFMVLYLADAATYLIFWVAIATLRRYGGPVTRDKDDIEVRGGWGVALRDRRLLGVVLASLVLITCGYGSLEAGLAIFITDTAQLSARLIGIVFLVNTLTIVVGQLFVLKWLRGRSRVRLLGLTALLWAASWFLGALVPGFPTWAAVTLLLIATLIFALGETVWSPTVPSLINAIAPDHLRGRYNAAQALTWSLGSMLAPVFTGVLIGAGLGVLWAIIIACGCLVAGLLSQLLRRELTPAEDGREEVVTA